MNISIHPAKRNLSTSHISENFSKRIRSAASHFGYKDPTYRNAARWRRSQRGQRCLAFSFRLKLEKYVFQGSFLSRVFCAAGKFCEVFPAKFTGERTVCKRHYPLSPGQKNGQAACGPRGKFLVQAASHLQKRPAATRKYRGLRRSFLQPQGKIVCVLSLNYMKASAFLPRFNTRKDPVFSDRVLVVAGTGLEPATSGL